MTLLAGTHPLNPPPIQPGPLTYSSAHTSNLQRKINAEQETKSVAMETGFLHNYGNTDSVVNNDTERQPCKLKTTTEPLTWRGSFLPLRLSLFRWPVRTQDVLCQRREINIPPMNHQLLLRNIERLGLKRRSLIHSPEGSEPCGRFTTSTRESRTVLSKEHIPGPGFKFSGIFSTSLKIQAKAAMRLTNLAFGKIYHAINSINCNWYLYYPLNY
eukprot:bmy_02401T0